MNQQQRGGYSENRATHATKRQLNTVRFEYYFIEKKRDEKMDR